MHNYAQFLGSNRPEGGGEYGQGSKGAKQAERERNIKFVSYKLYLMVESTQLYFVKKENL